MFKIEWANIIRKKEYLVSSADNSFAKSLDSDQARQHGGPGLDPNCLTLW